MKEKKILRLILKILIGCLLCLWALILALHFTFSYVASLPSTKEKIVSAVKEQLNADISIGSMSAGIFDIKITDVSLTVNGNNVSSLDVIYVNFSLKHLIKGHVRINNIIINNFNLTIIKDKDGNYNFDPILQAPAFKEDENKKEEKKKKKTDEEDDDVFDILIKKINFNDFNIYYIDEQENISASINRLQFTAYDINLEKPFDIFIYFNILFKNKDFNIEELHISLSSTININSLKLPEANVLVKNFIVRLKNSVIKTSGNILDFENPKVELNTKILNLSSESLKGIADVPAFLIPEIDIETKINSTLNESLLNIEKFVINVLDCNVVADGNINYAKDLKYDINVVIKFILDKITQTVDMLKPYKATGEIQSKLNITNESSVVSGNISIINIAAFLPQFGNVNEINSDIAIKNIDDINMPSLTGKINSYPFVSSASYLANEKKGKLKAKFFADRIYGKMSKEYEAQQKKLQEEKDKQANMQNISKEINKNKKDTNEQNIKQETQKQKTQTIQKEIKTPVKPIDVEVYFKANHINVPYFVGKDVKFTMNMKNVTPALDSLEGNISLLTADGTIKDIYKLTESNALMKGMFLSLRIVSNVVNALNVLDILHSIGSAVVSSKEKKSESEMTDEDSANRKEKLDGQIDFLSFITAMTFKEGKGVFKNCSFVSNLMSFKVAGNIDFKENLVDMAVNAAPGRHEEKEGIMPLKMNITGTTDEPSGSLSVLGSISTLVGDALTKNIVSGNLKAGFTKLLGLKKYDENGNDIVGPETKDKKKKKKKK